VSSTGAGQDGARSPGLEVGVMLAPGDRNGALADGEPSGRGPTPLAPSSVSAPAGAAGQPPASAADLAPASAADLAPASAADLAPASAADLAEEVTVCEVCGLVSRLSRSPACPACGAGHG
jgi:hypothetical protein